MNDVGSVGLVERVAWLLAVCTLAGFSATVVYAADNPVAVESLTNDSFETLPAVTIRRPMPPQGRIGELDEEVAFQAPVLADDALGGMEEAYQIQLLQQEVSELRGLIEELRYSVDTTKRLSDERYLELDGRFQALRQETGERAAAVTGVAVTPATAVGEAPATTPPELASGLKGDVSEQSLYDTALELIRNRQYEVAISQLQAMIDQYPEGNLAPNGYYWLGEVHAALPEPNFEQARQALAQVITFFPEHNKVPAAAFKLGKVYYLMGDCARAVETLRAVIADHPGKSGGKLAEAYLRDKVNCGQR